MASNIVIFGDSYSTFENYVPEGYEVYYTEEGNLETDVTKVTQTWWYQVITEGNMNLILNNSWSGSTICYTGYNNIDCSNSSSFIYRFYELLEKDFFSKTKIDTVLIFGGTNDSWADAPLGELKYENWEKQDLYFVLPAIAYYFKLLKENLPNTDIYCMINTELKPEISAGMKAVCEKYGINTITFEEIDKNYGHPTIKGMQDIKNTVLGVLKEKLS